MKITRDEFREKMAKAFNNIIGSTDSFGAVFMTAALGSQCEIKLFGFDEAKVTEIDKNEKDIAGTVFLTAAEMTIKFEEPSLLPIFTAIGVEFDKILEGNNEKGEE